MNFRRQPFQFTSIDPVKRHAELQKRFGLPSDEMVVDCVNSGIMGAGEDSSINSSPRLQHRVPIFSQGVHPTKSASSHNNVDNGHQPRVRVIPIQVEGVDDTSRRHRTHSSPSSTVKSRNLREQSPGQSVESHPVVENVVKKNPDQPRVCNIPINIESKKGKEKEPKRKETVIPTVIERKEQPPEDSGYGCTVSKSKEHSADVSLKQIEDVLNKFKGYQAEVEKFSGTNKDKQYRYLDEMLTRCMLDLDNVDTFGMDNVRQSRKNAVKQVQACIDLLETKVTSQSTVSVPIETVSASTDANRSPVDEQRDVMVTDTEMKECDGKNVDVEMEKDNSVEESVSSQLTQACDIEMEDRSVEDQSAKIVIEELEEPVENLTEVKTANINVEDVSFENQNEELIEKMNEDVGNSIGENITIKKVKEDSEGVVIEEMCSDIDKSPDQERTIASEVNAEPVAAEINSELVITEVNPESVVTEATSEPIITEHDSSELPELSNNMPNEQVLTFSSDNSDQSNSPNSKVTEEISITEIPNKTDVIVEECV